MKWIAVILAGIILCGVALAAPVAAPGGDINSNGFNVTATGVTGTDVWGEWGDLPGYQNWNTPNYSATAGTATVQFLGTPIFGGEIVYYKVCDPTGCSAEQHLTILAVTTMPTSTFGIPMRNITNSRFDPKVIIASLGSGLTTVAPFTVVIGIALFFFMIGVWFRTKSVKLIAILGILMAPFVMLGTTGLYLGIPSVGVLLAKGLVSLAIAGILFSWMRK
jgi:hypothetical protein